MPCRTHSSHPINPTNLLLGFVLCVQPTFCPALELTAKDQEEVSLTIFKSVAVVRDTRTVAKRGDRELVFKDVSGGLIPETCGLEGADVVEQNFDYDLLTLRNLIGKHVNKPARLARLNPASGKENTEQVRIVSFQDDQAVVKFADGHLESVPANLHSGPGVWRFIFDKVPESLKETPTLSMVIDGAVSRSVRLSCLSENLGWQSDYVAVLSANQQSIALKGWVTLHNQTGIDYRNAKVDIAAGDVKNLRARLSRHPPAPKMMSRMAVADAARRERLPQEESVGDIKLFSLPFRTTVKHKQSKQVALLSAANVKVRKLYVLRDALYENHGGDRPRKAVVAYRFENDKAHGLGQAVPKGIIRFYTKSQSGDLQFLGSDRVGNIDRGQTVTAEVATAFGVTIIKRKVKNPSGWNDRYTRSFEYTLINSTDDALTLTLKLRGRDLQSILADGQKGLIRKAPGYYEWNIEVPAAGEIKRRYTVEDKHRR